FAEYPLGTFLSIVTVVLLCTFFITSANSATFVLSMLSQDGDLNPASSKKLVWGILQAVIAYALLLSGGLKAL
ncbi:MAG: BCCT family transporter, partial [Finegoldia magna]|nr:BCCT family transporter [Finegoldia magna]